MTGEQLAVLLTAVTLVGVILGALTKFVLRPLWRLTVKTGHFLDSWNGEPARDGLPARPGVVERIVAIEYQLHPNKGGSIKDAVTRIEAAQKEQARLAAEVATALETRQAAVESEVALWRSIAARDVHSAATDVLADRPNQ